jgi:predicted acetyltransferase
MKWLYFALVTYAPVLVWSVLGLPVLFKYPGIHRHWRKTVSAGFLMSAIPYPLAYYLCRKVGFSCPAATGSMADFLVMTGTVLLGIALAGLWNAGFDRRLRKAYQRDGRTGR